MLYFYTITSPEQESLCDNLKKSLERFSYSLTILHLYHKNNFSKLKISTILQENTYTDDDIIIVCDGFDVVCASDPINIQNYFDKEDVDILISSENMFGNNLVCIKDYYDKYNMACGTSGKYLNAGVVIGRANKLKAFYKDLVDNVDTLRQYIPPDRQENTGDQTFIINYLYHIDFFNNKKKLDYKIKIDLKDDISFTNTIVNREYNINDYVFIHTWGIYITDPHYKYIRDQQFHKWSEINKILNLN